MIHVFNEGDDFPNSKWSVWTDCEADEHSGRCIGSAVTRKQALRDAEAELMTDLATVQHLLECESQSPKK